ncbi:sporulation histidine kinase inhibitor Sda [Paenibacillus swuensis]|nr:sporulation histidine kinase inhibitor Sda [Paenibacillus swuensis]
MHGISNEVLLDSYVRALDLKLEQDFIHLLLAEIRRRNLNIKVQLQGA